MQDQKCIRYKIIWLWKYSYKLIIYKIETTRGGPAQMHPSSDMHISHRQVYLYILYVYTLKTYLDIDKYNIYIYIFKLLIIAKFLKGGLRGATWCVYTHHVYRGTRNEAHMSPSQGSQLRFTEMSSWCATLLSLTASVEISVFPAAAE